MQNVNVHFRGLSVERRVVRGSVMGTHRSTGTCQVQKAFVFVDTPSSVGVGLFLHDYHVTSTPPPPSLRLWSPSTQTVWALCPEQ